MKKLLFFLCATLAFFGCGSDDGDLPPWSGLDRYELSSSSYYSSSSRAIVYGTPVTYQNETYQTVVIGTQTWFARNLNYNVEGSVCYNNQTSYCDTYGRLYNWSTAMGFSASCNSSTCSSQINTKHQGICPNGWHIPTYDEWDTLKNYIETNKGCSSCDAKHLKSTNGWYNEGNGLDSYGFAALPGGGGSSDGYFGDVGNGGDWWSASEYSANDAYLRFMLYYFYFEGAYWNDYSKATLLSIRCVQD